MLPSSPSNGGAAAAAYFTPPATPQRTGGIEQERSSPTESEVAELRHRTASVRADLESFHRERRELGNVGERPTAAAIATICAKIDRLSEDASMLERHNTPVETLQLLRDARNLASMLVYSSEAQAFRALWLKRSTTPPKTRDASAASSTSGGGAGAVPADESLAAGSAGGAGEATAARDEANAAKAEALAAAAAARSAATAASANAVGADLRTLLDFFSAPQSAAEAGSVVPSAELSTAAPAAPSVSETYGWLTRLYEMPPPAMAAPPAVQAYSAERDGTESAYFPGEEALPVAAANSGGDPALCADSATLVTTEAIESSGGQVDLAPTPPPPPECADSEEARRIWDPGGPGHPHLRVRISNRGSAHRRLHASVA